MNAALCTLLILALEQFAKNSLGTAVVKHATFSANTDELDFRPYLRQDEFTVTNFSTGMARSRRHMGRARPHVPTTTDNPRDGEKLMRGRTPIIGPGAPRKSQSFRLSRGVAETSSKGDGKWFVRPGWFSKKQTPERGGPGLHSLEPNPGNGGKSNSPQKTGKHVNKDDKRYTVPTFPLSIDGIIHADSGMKDVDNVKNARAARNVFEIAPFLHVPKNERSHEGYANPPIIEESDSPELIESRQLTNKGRQVNATVCDQIQL